MFDFFLELDDSSNEEAANDSLHDENGREVSLHVVDAHQHVRNNLVLFVKARFATVGQRRAQVNAKVWCHCSKSKKKVNIFLKHEF